MDALTELTRAALVLTATLALPVIAVATLAGVAVAVLQAATQVQEQTLTLLPKLLAVGAMTAAFGGFALHACAEAFRHAVALAPALARGL